MAQGRERLQSRHVYDISSRRFAQGRYRPAPKRRARAWESERRKKNGVTASLETSEC
jgi:hypothetical protein